MSHSHSRCMRCKSPPKAEELIARYLEQKAEDPKFTKHLNKGAKVKSDKLLDLPFRDMDNNVDQDITWRSSSQAPYR